MLLITIPYITEILGIDLFRGALVWKLKEEFWVQGDLSLVPGGVETPIGVGRLIGDVGRHEMQKSKGRLRALFELISQIIGVDDSRAQ
jgi:hypothetical protein